MINEEYLSVKKDPLFDFSFLLKMIQMYVNSLSIINILSYEVEKDHWLSIGGKSSFVVWIIKIFWNIFKYICFFEFQI